MYIVVSEKCVNALFGYRGVRFRVVLIRLNALICLRKDGKQYRQNRCNPFQVSIRWNTVTRQQLKKPLVYRHIALNHLTT